MALPSNIAILITSEASYGKAFRSLLSGKKGFANVALASSLRESSLGTWLAMLIQMFAGEEDSKNFATFAAHPMTCDALDASEALSQMDRDSLYRTAIKESHRWRKDRAVSDDHAPAMKNYFGELSSRLQLLLDIEVSGARKNTHTRGSCTGLFLVVRFFYRAPSHQTPESSLEVSAASSLEEFYREIGTFERGDPINLSLAEFCQLLKTKLLSREVRTVGYPLKGVQILSLIEARYVPFEVLIVCGCREGLFPRALPADFLVDDWLKRQIGLPGWGYIESLEETTFRLLSQRSKRMELLYAKSDSGEETVRSRFLEHLLAQNLATLECWSTQGILEKHLFLGTMPEDSSALARPLAAAGSLPIERSTLTQRLSATS